MQLSPGDRVGPYEILRPLGAGGMGEVYCARDEKLGRDIALKLLPADLSEAPEAMRRFEQEARAASALNHPNIVTIYEINRAASFSWIAMELVEGDDLRTLTRRDPLNLRNALRIAGKVADGLAAAHERGIVHRDLKPDNVMVTPDGFVKILDFGLAKQLRALSSEDTTVPHTSPGTIFGTVAYMSPEQATGKEMDARSDQFSFGVMLYEMITGRRPFERETRTETLAAILRDEVAPPSTLNPKIPRELDRIIARCLAKHPRDRYGSTRDLARDLREVRESLSDSSVHRSSPPPSARRKGSLVWAVGTVLVIALVAAGTIMWRRRASARQITSIAVVPFRDLDGTVQGRVFADGISEMVAARLTQTPELHVASPFDGAPIAEGDDVREIARRTGAKAVVRGSVQHGGQNVRVTFSLVDARNGDTLAGGTMTRPETDLFSLQDLVADEILRVLGRVAPERRQNAAAILGADDQRRYTEAVGLLQRVRDEKSVDRAIELLESILRNTRESGQVNALLARALLYKSSLARRPVLIEQATVYARRAVALNGADPESHVTLGRLQNASGEYAVAVGSFEHALELLPDDVDALAGLAEAYQGSGRNADADRMYRKAISMRPDVYGAYVEYGAFCYSQGRYGDAAANFRKATELMPGLAHAHANLGAALMALGKNDEALHAYQTSLRLQPTAPGFSNLGTLQFSLQRYDAAIQSYERATQLSPADPVAWANLGDAYRWAPGQRGRSIDAYARAANAARAALGVNENDAYMHSVLALSLAKGGHADEGQQEIRRALELDPTNPSVLYKAAVIALMRGNPDSATSWIERAVASGYPGAELKTDPELQALRGTPSFQQALQSKK